MCGVCCCSAFDGDPSELTLGDEVEFSLSRKVGKVSAEGLRKLQKGSVAPEDVAPEVIDGKILRCMRIVNPEQEDYPGIVEVDNSGACEAKSQPPFLVQKILLW